MFRIQTYYLIACFIITGVLPFVFPLWKDVSGSAFYFMKDMAFVSLFGLSTTLSLLSILSHKKRQQQFVMGRLNMILNLILSAIMGVMIPLVLNRLGKDPAVGSSVLITAMTDSGGFFIFLGLATVVLL